MVLHAMINDLYNESELQDIVDFSNSSEYKNSGFRPDGCYATKIEELLKDFDKTSTIMEVVGNVNKESWKYDLQEEFKNPTIHTYIADYMLPMDRISFQTHRDSLKKGFEWHYDNIDTGNTITVIVKVHEDDGNISFISDGLRTYNEPIGSGLILPSLVPYNIKINSGVGMYIIHYIN